MYQNFGNYAVQKRSPPPPARNLGTKAQQSQRYSQLFASCFPATTSSILYLALEARPHSFAASFCALLLPAAQHTREVGIERIKYYERNKSFQF